MSITIKTPGKLILSGEHSVVYGASALAIAIDCHLILHFTPNSLSNHLPKTTNNQGVITIVSPLGTTSKPINQLDLLKEELDEQHQQYLEGSLASKSLIKDPHDLLFYVLANNHFKESGKIDIQSNIPLGAGMGSSAACIASALALCHCVSKNKIDLAEYVKQIKWSERLQHGKGSLIDAAAISYGGLVEVCQEKVHRLPMNLSSNIFSHFFIWNSGSPNYTTKEVVSYVEYQQHPKIIWETFDEVTQQFKLALLDTDNVLNKHKVLQQIIKENHRLLCQIDVVPKIIRKMIDWINQYHGAAKVCGAGSLPKDKVAGQILVYLPCLDSVEKLQSKGIKLSPITVSPNGFNVISNQ